MVPGRQIIGTGPRPLHRNIEVAAEAGSDVGQAIDVLLRRFDDLDDRVGVVRVHAQHFRGDGELHLSGPGTDEGRRKRTHVHGSKLRYAPQVNVYASLSTELAAADALLLT